MLMLLAFVPLALIGFTLVGDDDDDDTINGTPEDDRIEGETGDDLIDAQAGDDVLNGRAGDDTIFGGEGVDILQGQDGDDLLDAGDGDDFATGNTGADTLEGQAGDDWLSGDLDADLVRGDDGNDTVIGGRGADVVEGGEGDDLIFGGILQGIPLTLEEMTEVRDGATLEEVNGTLQIHDDSVGNVLNGGSGADDLVVGSLDMVSGGAGSDTFHLMSGQSDEGAATILDFSADSDAITVIVDDPDADADIDVTTDGADALVVIGDTVLARVQGAAETLTTADVTLIAASAVERLFDPNGVAA